MEIVLNEETQKRNKQLCEEFIHSHNRPKYIFGTNEFAQSVAQYVNVDGFIDEFTEKTSFLGKPIIHSLQDISKNSIVLSCNVWGRPVSVKNKLNAHTISNIDYYSFIQFSQLPILDIEYWAEFKDLYYSNIHEYKKLVTILADEESINTLDLIVKFRLSYDLNYMSSFKDLQHQQYFEDFLQLQKTGESFVDVGGFDGYTSQEFIKHCPEYSKIYFLEPDINNMIKAQSLLQESNNIEYFELGASDSKKRLRFDNTAGSANKISEKGSVSILVDALDNLIYSPVTYIKMDIEGAESLAIDGAKQTILKYHPRLAICVYHKGNDLIDIPNQIFSIRKDYNIYLRHYTEGVVETVMFFVPQKHV